MKLKKRLPALFLALFLAFSPFFFVVPANASSDVLGGVPSADPSPGFFTATFPDGSVRVWDPLIVDGFDPAAAGYFGVIELEGNYIRAKFFDVPVVSIVYDSSSFDVVITFGESYSEYYYGILTPKNGSSWTSSGFASPINIPTSTFEDDYSGSYVWLINVPSSVSVPSNLPLLDLDYSPPVTSSGGPGILSVFTGVSSWLGGAVSNMISMFYTAESGLTVLGVLAVASLALAFILLLLYLIAGWLKFR